MADDSYVKEIQVRNLTNTMIDVVNGMGPGGGGGPANWNTMINKPPTFAPIIGSLATQAVAGNDARLTNARTPTTHNHNASAINAGVMDVARLGTGTANGTTILFGDGTWKAAPSGGVDGGADPLIKTPTSSLAMSAPIPGRSVGVLASVTDMNTLGTEYGISNGWISKTTDGWITKTDGAQAVSGGHGYFLRFVVWADGSLCAITSDNKIITMADTASGTEQVVTLTAEYAFSGLGVHFYENDSTRYVIVGEYNQNTRTSKKLYLSKDGGATWAVIKQGNTAGLTNNHWHGVTYDPYASAIWAAEGDTEGSQLSYSMDLGETWNDLTAPGLGYLQPTLIHAFPQRVIFGRDSGDLSPGMDQWIRPANTQPEGAQAVEIDALQFEQDLPSHVFYPENETTAPVPRRPNECYIAFTRKDSSGNPSYIYATGDGGASWHLVWSGADRVTSMTTDGIKLYAVSDGGATTGAPLLTWKGAPSGDGGGGADPRIITGAGRPDIPATLTAEVADLVAAATSGTEFRSTDGPQGAWVWMKRGASWVATDGDTGERNVSETLINGWTGTGISIRRVDSVVYFVSKLKGGTENLDGTSSTSQQFLPIPQGFRFPYGSYVPNGSFYGGREFGVESGNLHILDPSASRVNLYGYGMWDVRDPWPTTLPGTPA